MQPQMRPIYSYLLGVGFANFALVSFVVPVSPACPFHFILFLVYLYLAQAQRQQLYFLAFRTRYARLLPARMLNMHFHFNIKNLNAFLSGRLSVWAAASVDPLPIWQIASAVNVCKSIHQTSVWPSKQLLSFIKSARISDNSCPHTQYKK